MKAVKHPFFLASVLVLFLAPVAFSQSQDGNDWMTKGVEAFRNQENDQALVFFDQASQANPLDDAPLLYLGVIHQSAGAFQSAEEAYSSGLRLQGPYASRIRLNRGNLRVSAGNLDGAREDFTVLVESGDSLANQARLNRANTALRGGQHRAALEDYVAYLEAVPLDPQRDAIEEMIGLLGAHLASEAERARIAVEQARLEEEARLLEEQRRAEEEARRQALLAEVLQSLNDSGQETTAIGAGTENLVEEFEESDLED